MKWLRRASAACVVIWSVLSMQGAMAQQQKPPQPKTQITQQEQIAIERKAAFEAADKAAKRGPTVIPLGSQGLMALPAGMLFIPQPEASRVLRAMGNSGSSELIGLVWANSDQENWFATVRFVKSGYIKDDDARNWNMTELLQNLKDGTEEGNAERITRGFPALEVVGWVERPDYDAENRRLVWSVNARHKDAPASERESVNYNTYVLGREGYFSLNFVTDMQSIATQKPIARELLSAMSFEPGKTYADYNSLTDHAAEFGIGALIAGGAAKKLGLFAVFGVFLAKAGKLIIIPLVAGGALLRKLFGRSKDPAR